MTDVTQGPAPAAPETSAEPGIYHGKTMEWYRALDYASPSDLHVFRAYGPYYYSRTIDKERRARCLELGTDLHCALLEPHKFVGGELDEYEVCADGWNRNPGRTERIAAMAAGRRAIRRSDLAYCLRAREAVAAHPYAADLFAGSAKEVSLVGRIGANTLKGRPDLLNIKARVLGDVKRTNAFAPWEFARTLWKYDYHLRAAMYWDLAASLGIKLKWVVFVVIRADPRVPEVAIYTMPESWIELGRKHYREQLARYNACCFDNDWHSDYERPMQLPDPQSWQTGEDGLDMNEEGEQDGSDESGGEDAGE